MGIKIMNVTVKDAKELLAIYAPYVRDTAISFEYTVPTLSDFKKRINLISKKFVYIKAVDENGKIVGYAYAGTFRKRMAYHKSVESTVYVKQDERKHGYGRVLYEELLKRLKKKKFHVVEASIAIPSKNDKYVTNASRKFHTKMGFKNVGIFHDVGYKFNKYYDMLFMEKIL